MFSPLALSFELCSFFFYQTVSFIGIGIAYAEADARPLGETESVVFIECRAAGAVEFHGNVVSVHEMILE